MSQPRTSEPEQRTTREKMSLGISWLAVLLMVLLAAGTITENEPGTPVRMALATLIYLGLAAFAAPPVRRYIADTYRLRFPQWIVATILIVAALINELLISPELISEVPP